MPEEAEPPEAVRGDVRSPANTLGTDLPAAVFAPLVAAWARLFGLIGSELFVQFHQVVQAREEFFGQSAAALARTAGLDGGDR
jgi:hypothetical protein